MSGPMSDDSRWQTIHQRLGHFEQRLTDGFAATPDEQDSRLRERTRQWSELPEDEDANDWLEVLTFSLSGEIYAISSEHVSQVEPLNQYTPLPGTPPWLLGIVNVRGRVVSVVDLRVLFELPVNGLADRSSLAVLQGPEMEFGLLIDRVLGIGRIHRGTLQPDVANLTGIRAAYLLGVTAQQWTVLDGAKLLGDPNMRVNID